MCDHTNKNIYLPYLATVEEVIDETPDVRTLRLVFQDEQVTGQLHLPGRAVCRVFRLRGRRIDLLHRLFTDPERVHRVLLPLGRAG